LIKINDFNVKIINFKGFQSVLLSNFVIKYCYFHENSYFDQNMIKKIFMKKNIFFYENFFFVMKFFPKKIDFFDRKCEIRTQSEPLSSKMRFSSDFIVRIIIYFFHLLLTWSLKQ